MKSSGETQQVFLSRSENTVHSRPKTKTKYGFVFVYARRYFAKNAHLFSSALKQPRRLASNGYIFAQELRYTQGRM